VFRGVIHPNPWPHEAFMNPGRFQPGTDILAPWGDDPYLYPAIVLGVDPSSRQAFVIYWGGNTAGVHDDLLRPLDLRPGMEVEVDFRGENSYERCTISRGLGGALCFVNQSGHEVWAAFSKVRVRRR
jgi:hypothetical protein